MLIRNSSEVPSAVVRGGVAILFLKVILGFDVRYVFGFEWIFIDVVCVRFVLFYGYLRIQTNRAVPLVVVRGSIDRTGVVLTAKQENGGNFDDVAVSVRGYTF